MHDVIYGLMRWVWLKKESLGLFARDCQQAALGKDALYDTLNREDLNWRKVHGQIASKTVQGFKSHGKKSLCGC